MSKLLDRLHITHEAPAHEAPERVPESPEVVDHRRRIEEPPRAASGIRWLRWVPVVAVLAGGALVVTMLVSDSGTDEVIEYTTVSEGPGSNSLGPTPAPRAVSSYQLVQESIDAALLANQPTTLDVLLQDLEQNTAITPVSSQQLVQESIDAALLANQPTTLDVLLQDLEQNTAITPVSSQQLVQESIDAALAANQPAIAAVPRTADGAEGWILSAQTAAVPRTADGAEGWIESTQTPTLSSQQLVQESIDAALLANLRANTVPRTADGAEGWIESTQTSTVSAQQLIQDAIDDALAANQAAAEASPLTNPTTGPGSTSLGPTG